MIYQFSANEERPSDSAPVSLWHDERLIKGNMCADLLCTKHAPKHMFSAVAMGYSCTRRLDGLWRGIIDERYQTNFFSIFVLLSPHNVHTLHHSSAGAPPSDLIALKLVWQHAQNHSWAPLPHRLQTLGFQYRAELSYYSSHPAALYIHTLSGGPVSKLLRCSTVDSSLGLQSVVSSHLSGCFLPCSVQ